MSVGSLLLFASLAVYHLAAGGALFSRGSLVLGALLLFSATATLLNLGDRYLVDDEGITYSNGILSRLGLKLERRIAWKEVVSVQARRGAGHGVREAAPGALFLCLASGQRFIVDSVDGFEEFHRLVASRLEGKGPE